MRRTVRSFARVGAILLVGVLGACAGAPMQAPPEFVELKGGGDVWRAVTSDDARLRVRDVVDPTEGADAQFWANALRQDLVHQRGYEPIGSGEVENRGGGAGHWLEFAANVRGERVGYLVAVWVVDGRWPFGAPRVRVVEFAGNEAAFRARRDAVVEALGTVRD